MTGSGGNCRICGKSIRSLKHGKRHWRRVHKDEEREYETPEEALPDTVTEQRDFEGEEPDTSEHDPEYMAENDAVETEDSTLFDYGGE